MTILLGKKITAPNGQKIQIFAENTKAGRKSFVKISAIAKALGYSAFNCRNSLLGTVFKNHKFTLYTKQIVGAAAYVADLNEIVPILEEFIKLTFVVQESPYTALQDNARMEAERLIELFNTEVFGKPSTIKQATLNLAEPTLQETTPERKRQMENNNSEKTMELFHADDADKIQTEETLPTGSTPPQKQLDELAAFAGIGQADLAEAILELRETKFEREQERIKRLLLNEQVKETS